MVAIGAGQKKHSKELGYEAREDGGEAGGSVISGINDL